MWQDGSGRAEQSLAYFLPEDMELVVLANSPIGTANDFFRDIVTDVYVANLHPLFDLPFVNERVGGTHHSVAAGR